MQAIILFFLLFIGIQTTSADTASNNDAAINIAADPSTTDSRTPPPPRNTPGLPPNGMSMNKVEQQFGKPATIKPATGNPPITRWVYNDFTVYFEGKYVIHTVKNRSFKRGNERLNSNTAD